jgi:hypothetical protein
MDPDSSFNPTRWTSTVYRARSHVTCPLEKAWTILLNYPEWNPHFAGAKITAIRGNPGAEGECVLIRDNVPYVPDEDPPEFYAETIAVRGPHNIVWRVFPKIGNTFLNIVDFSLSAGDSGVDFSLAYYEQLAIAPHLLSEHRHTSTSAYEQTVKAFKTFCESHAQPRNPITP